MAASNSTDVRPAICRRRNPRWDNPVHGRKRLLARATGLWGIRKSVCERLPRRWRRNTDATEFMLATSLSMAPLAAKKIRRRAPDLVNHMGEDGLISIEGIVEAFALPYRQPRTAWSFEVEVRTAKEAWKRALTGGATAGPTSVGEAD